MGRPAMGTQDGVCKGKAGRTGQAAAPWCTAGGVYTGTRLSCLRMHPQANRRQQDHELTQGFLQHRNPNTEKIVSLRRKPGVPVTHSRCGSANGQGSTARAALAPHDRKRTASPPPLESGVKCFRDHWRGCTVALCSAVGAAPVSEAIQEAGSPTPA